ncbi:MAG: DUF2024 family protein [Balneolaceae bacterium]|nr:MAG: DUF2024 family protein [Balneolaceae bacterium]
MRIAVYDTYVTKKEGGTMHFDILVPEKDPVEKVLGYGKEYLSSKGQGGQPITPKECRFCHIEKASEDLTEKIAKSGYSIIEMEGC